MSKARSKRVEVAQDEVMPGAEEMPTESENTAVKAQEGTQANPEMQILDDEKLGHMCIVLGPATRKQLLKGEPLIIGTSNASVEAFFHKLISVCQMGAHMPVIFQNLSGAVSVSNIKKKKSGIITQPRTERYPVPSGLGLFGIPSLSKKKSHSKKGQEEQGEYNSLPEAEPSAETAEDNPTHGLEFVVEGSSPKAIVSAPAKVQSERDEIPLEAIRLYLAEKRYFPGWNANAKRNLRKRCKDFQLGEDGQLFYRTKKNTLLPCVEDRARRMNVIWEAHIIDHRRRDGLLNMIRDKYYWKGMFQDVNKVFILSSDAPNQFSHSQLDSCEVCKQHRLNKQNEQDEHLTDDEDAVTINMDVVENEKETIRKRKLSSRREKKVSKTVNEPMPSSMNAEEGQEEEDDEMMFEKYPETSEIAFNQDM